MPDLGFKYLEWVEKKGIHPNFWCSREYFEKAGFVETEEDSLIFIKDKNGDIMFPPLTQNCSREFEKLKTKRGLSGWAGFVGLERKFGIKTGFLDYEYLYAPKEFLDLSGKKWKTFRKNIRKYPDRFGGDLEYRSFADEIDEFKIHQFVELWADEIGWDDIQDGEVLMEYVFSGENREILIDNCSEEIHGINIWDENYSFINYRFCLCLNKPFLSEYLRYLFYINKAEKYKIVNDGGTLGYEKLKQFKDKLNPIKVNKIYGWKVV